MTLLLYFATRSLNDLKVLEVLIWTRYEVSMKTVRRATSSPVVIDLRNIDFISRFQQPISNNTRQ